MSGRHHALLGGLAAAHDDALGAYVRGLPGALELDLDAVAGLAHVFDVEVLDIGEPVGETPGDPAVVPGHHPGQPREAHPADLEVGRGQVVLVPDRRCGEAEVHVVGQQGGSGLGP